MKSKKGETLTLKQLMGSVIAAMMIVIFIIIQTQVTDPELFTSIYLARDTALLAEAAQALPYDVHYQYPTTVKNRNIYIDEGKVRVVVDASETDDIFSMQEEKLSVFPLYSLGKKNYTVDAALFTIITHQNNLEFYSGIVAPKKQTIKQQITYVIQPKTTVSELQPFVSLFAQELQQDSGVNLSVEFSKGKNNILASSQVAFLAQNIQERINTTFKTRIPITTTVRSDPFIQITVNTSLVDQIRSDQQLFARKLAQELMIYG